MDDCVGHEDCNASNEFEATYLKQHMLSCAGNPQ